MSNISTEDVRGIVREETHSLEKAMIKMADAMEKVAVTLNEVATHSHVTDEKFVRVYERHNETQDRISQLDNVIMTITTIILPRVEAAVAVNSFSSAKMWKVAFAVTLPLIIGAWGVLERFNSLQADQMKTVVEALKGLGRVVGTH